MDQFVRKNFTAQFQISMANGASKQKVWKMGSPNMNPAYAMCRARLNFEIDEMKTVSPPQGFNCSMSMQGVNYSTADFFNCQNIFHLTIPYNVTNVQFVVSNPTLVEVVPFSTFVPGCDPFLAAVFIKQTAPAIAVDQDLGTIKVIFTTGEGIVVTSPTVGLAAAESYANTIPPIAPSNVVATKMTGPLRAVINWQDNSNNETYFYIYKIISNGTPNFINGVAAGITTYTDTSGYPGDHVKFEVRASNGSAMSSAAVSNQITL